MMNGNNKLFRSRNVIRFLLCFFLPAAMLLYERIRLGAIGNLTADAELYLSVADNFLNTGHFIQCIRWFPGFVVPPGMPLILLIRDQVLYRDLLEIYIRDVLIEIKFHFYWSFLSDSSIDAIA